MKQKSRRDLAPSEVVPGPGHFDASICRWVYPARVIPPPEAPRPVYVQVQSRTIQVGTIQRYHDEHGNARHRATSRGGVTTEYWGDRTDLTEQGLKMMHEVRT